MEAFGPFVLTERLTPEGVLQERFRARRVSAGDVSGPQVLTRREGSPEDLAGLLRSWCESAARRDAAAHAGVTRCLEVGAAGGFVYEVSELADGDSLQALLEAYAFAREHPPLDVALGVATALAALLLELQGRGMAVGYLVPENLLITWDGRVVLDRIGVPEETVRRPAWTAPELVKKTGADARTDAWVLGRVLKGVLSGHAGTRPRVPARHAGPIRELLRSLLAVSRRRRLPLAEGAGQLTALLTAIGVAAPGPLLSSIMAARFAASDRRSDERLDLAELKRTARGATNEVERFYPLGAGSSPLPVLPSSFGRDETESDAYQAKRRPHDDSVTQASVPAFSDEEVPRSDSGSGSDEGGPPELELVSDPLQPVRTEVTEVPLGPGGLRSQGLLASDPDDGGSLPWADAESATDGSPEGPAEGDVGDDDDLDLHMDAHLPPLEPPFGAASADRGPPAPKTVVSDGPVVIDLTRPDAGPTAEPSDQPATVAVRVKAPQPMNPDARTRTGTGHELPYQEVPSLDDVWADSGRNRAAPAPKVVRADATEVLDLPKARVLESAAGAVFAEGADLHADHTMMLEPPPTDPHAAPPSVHPTGPRSAPPTVAARPRSRPSSAPRIDDKLGSLSELGSSELHDKALSDPYGGVLVIDAPEDATVYVDGQRRGQGPLKLEGMPREGLVHVRVTAAGFRPWAAEVSLDGQPAARVTARLVRR